MGLELEVRYGDGHVERRNVSQGRHRIGREGGDLVIGDPSISAHHADLDVGANAITITDANSRNGTYDPGGSRLSAPYALMPGQAIRLGECTLTWLPSAMQSGGTRVMSAMPAPNPNSPAPSVTSPPPIVVASTSPLSDAIRVGAAAQGARPRPFINAKGALILGLTLLVAFGTYTGAGFLQNKLSKKPRYSYYQFSYKCWQNYVGWMVGPARCEATVGDKTLKDSEVQRYKEKLFSDGWELVTATDEDLWTTMHFRREND